MLEEEATILDATGRASGWQFRILFPEHDSVSATHGFCENNGVDLEFERIFELSDSLRRGQYGLSESQYETIVRAYNDGYYDIPRERNLQELAEDLDVSHQSLSERIRRGHEQLVGNTLRPELETVTNP